MKICKANLDKKVNCEETLRDYIKNSMYDFCGSYISDEKIDSWREGELVKIVEYFDNLWEK